MYKVCYLWLGLDFGVRLATDKNFYWRSTIAEMHVSAVFIEEFLRPYGCSCTNFMAAVNRTKPKLKYNMKITETQIMGIQIYFAIK